MPALLPCTTGMISTPRTKPLSTMAKTATLAQIRHGRSRVARQVAVIAAVGGEPSGLAAKAATATIPIVCSLGGDAVEAGLVDSLNRPSGNITGVTLMAQEMGPKRLEFAHQLVPNGNAFAALVNPKFPLALAEATGM